MPPLRPLSAIIRKKSPAAKIATLRASLEVQHLGSITPTSDMRTYVTSAREGYEEYHRDDDLWVFSKPILASRDRSVGVEPLRDYIDRHAGKSEIRHVLYELPFEVSGLMVCVLNQRALDALRAKPLEIGFRVLMHNNARRHAALGTTTLTTDCGPMVVELTGTGRSMGTPKREDVTAAYVRTHTLRGKVPDICRALDGTVLTQPRVMVHAARMTIEAGVLSDVASVLDIVHRADPFRDFYVESHKKEIPKT